MSNSRAHKNRAVRQEALREQLANQGHLQHIIDLLAEIENLDKELDANQINRLKIVVDTKLSLLKKYLPDLKAVEVTGDGGDELVVKVIKKDFTGADS